ncbi:helix-turn-helix domain-containing protein [Mycobacterium sp. ENV421]|uniref:helix-turn-helix domain-containing protein n=1 Tax=Mycobacterium sp. ENV421 TaxID=1213407 RepID=UPI00115A8F6E|nr:helix-turn-helix domain-containing protein [Mycobacterium sp. ENV421]
MNAANAGPITADSCVVLTGKWLDAAHQAVLIANRTRKHNGLPASAAYSALASAFSIAAMSRVGQSDVGETAAVQHFPREQPTVPISEAAEQLGLSRRQVQRIANKLGGRIIAGRWLLDQTAIDEHQEGRR